MAEGFVLRVRLGVRTRRAEHRDRNAAPNDHRHGLGYPPPYWPWDVKWWKPKDARRDLVRAAALIVAEIERLDRMAERASGAKQVGGNG